MWAALRIVNGPEVVWDLSQKTARRKGEDNFRLDHLFSPPKSAIS